MTVISSLVSTGILYPTKMPGIYGIKLKNNEIQPVPDKNQNGKTDLREVVDLLVDNTPDTNENGQKERSEVIDYLSKDFPSFPIRYIDKKAR